MRMMRKKIQEPMDAYDHDVLQNHKAQLKQIERWLLEKNNQGFSYNVDEGVCQVDWYCPSCAVKQNQEWLDLEV
jgi:hypothetical protein